MHAVCAKFVKNICTATAKYKRAKNDTDWTDDAVDAPLNAFKMLPKMINCAGWLQPERKAIKHANAVYHMSHAVANLNSSPNVATRCFSADGVAAAAAAAESDASDFVVAVAADLVVNVADFAMSFSLLSSIGTLDWVETPMT